MSYIDQIINGNCLDVLRDMEDNSVDMVLTDIPYGAINRPSHGLRSLDKGKADIETFSLDIFMSGLIRVCSGSIYIFCSYQQLSMLLSLMDDGGLSVRSCIWTKTNPSPMNGQHIWLSGIEHCAYGKKSGATFNEHCRSGVWSFPSGSTKYHPTSKNLKLFEYLIGVSSNKGDIILDTCLGGYSTEYKGQLKDRWDNIPFVYAGSIRHPEAVLIPGTNKKAHPCQMPVALAERAILFSTNEGDVVLDPFIGSGSTAIACVRTKRLYIGIEISEEYCQLAHHRLRWELSQPCLDFGDK